MGGGRSDHRHFFRASSEILVVSLVAVGVAVAVAEAVAGLSNGEIVYSEYGFGEQSKSKVRRGC